MLTCPLPNFVPTFKLFKLISWNYFYFYDLSLSSLFCKQQYYCLFNVFKWLSTVQPNNQLNFFFSSWSTLILNLVLVPLGSFASEGHVAPETGSSLWELSYAEMEGWWGSVSFCLKMAEMWSQSLSVRGYSVTTKSEGLCLQRGLFVRIMWMRDRLRT